MQMNFRTIMLCVTLPHMSQEMHANVQGYLIEEFARAMRGTMLDGVPVVFIPQGVGVFPIVASETHESNPPPDAGPPLSATHQTYKEGSS